MATPVKKGTFGAKITQPSLKTNRDSRILVRTKVFSAMEVSETAVRTVADVDDVIQLAKLNPEDFLSVTQSLTFNRELVDPNTVKLMEVTPELADQLESGSRQIVIRGDPGDSAVLCSDSQTFDLREAETSNAVLLLENLKYPEQCKRDQRTVTECQVTGESFVLYFQFLLCHIHSEFECKVLNTTTSGLFFGRPEKKLKPKKLKLQKNSSKKAAKTQGKALKLDFWPTLRHLRTKNCFKCW